jgi:hypothetical protein
MNYQEKITARNLEICAAYEGGLTIKQCEAKFAVGQSSVRHALLSNNIKIRDRGNRTESGLANRRMVSSARSGGTCTHPSTKTSKSQDQSIPSSRSGKEKDMQRAQKTMISSPISASTTPTTGDTKRHWKPEEDALLRALWMADQGVQDIVEKLPHRTEHAIAARVVVLKLPRQKRHANKTPPGKIVKPRFWRHPIAETAFGPGIPLVDLKPDECHWPVTGKDCYCGARNNRNHGYCKEHEDLSWTKK